jgi:hypothetical protein
MQATKGVDAIDKFIEDGLKVEPETQAGDWINIFPHITHTEWRMALKVLKEAKEIIEVFKDDKMAVIMKKVHPQAFAEEIENPCKAWLNKWNKEFAEL